MDAYPQQPYTYKAVKEHTTEMCQYVAFSGKREVYQFMATQTV